jgi:glycosyltransferase involved in cell wall biosynthesis
MSCSVIIPCYNEAGNIVDCLRRIPKMGSFTEVIVVDDGSSDGTAAMVNADLNPEVTIKLISNKVNRGKGHAVREGFDRATGDVLMILDADMAVMPEELPRFLRIIEDGVADFVNGTRVIYPMESKSMPVLNYFGNKCFSIILSWIMQQRVSDTLCGTKAMLRKDYKRITLQDASWGDFDLLFGAAKLCLKIRELPVHYKIRKAGESKMKAFRHGWILLRVCLRGFAELRLGR